MSEVYLVGERKTVMPNRKEYTTFIVGEQRNEFIIGEREITQSLFRKRQTMHVRYVYLIDEE